MPKSTPHAQTCIGRSSCKQTLLTRGLIEAENKQISDERSFFLKKKTTSKYNFDHSIRHKTLVNIIPEGDIGYRQTTDR